MAKKVRLIEKPKLFTSQIARSALTRPGDSRYQGLEIANTNILSSASFRYDTAGSALKSTQELSVDYSEFQNHTFFSSAVVKTNVAFDKIINEFPFDGTAKDLESFEDSLTGWEAYVLNNFPKHVGYLVFSGTQTGETSGGTSIEVLNSTGYLFPGVSKGDDGRNVLDTKAGSFSFETFLFVPAQSNDNQTICQRISGSDGFSLNLSSSASSLSCDVNAVLGYQDQILTASYPLSKGSFKQICAVYDSNAGGILKLYVDSALVSTSSNTSEGINLSLGGATLTIGTGSYFRSFTPQQTLSGALDDFRFFKTARTVEDQRLNLRRSVFQSGDMSLYFKFNEPSGSYGIEDVVLDSSGNSLHSRVQSYSDYLRTSPFGIGPLINEDTSRSPILYPSHELVADYNARLLASASDYDEVNPNLITRLVPPHYFDEGQVQQGFVDQDGTIKDPYTSISIPGSGQLGQTQVLMSFLFIWSKFFDEMKMFLDSFSNLLHVDYEGKDAIPDKLLPFLARYYGISIPSIFSNANIDQFIRGQGVNSTDLRAYLPLKQAQNEIWKRILVNLQDIIRSKGTKRSIRSVLLAAGIDPDGVFTIREYGGPSKSSLKGLRQQRTEISAMLDMSGTVRDSAVNYQGYGLSPYIISPFLSASRTEAGIPYINGFFTSNTPSGVRMSNNKGDGLFTTSSFTYEGIYKWSNREVLLTSQSLARIFTTGSSVSRGGLLANLVAVSGSNPKLSLFVRPAYSTPSEPYLELSLTGTNIFDGGKWNVAFGRKAPGDQSQYPMYFLRCAKQNFGTVESVFSTGSYFDENSGAGSLTAFSGQSSTYNASGSFIVIGSQSIGSHNRFLNDTSDVPDVARSTFFDGKIAKIRFWSKYLNDQEWIEHVRNFKSLGTSDPETNFNFVPFGTGSFERLRVDADIDQPVTMSDSNGDIVIFDFSQNGFHLTGSNFETTKRVIKPETFNYSFLSPSFDVAQTDNKVRIRSLTSLDPEYPYATTAPVYDVPIDQYPDDDTRFSVDYSTVAALNEDIMKIFSTLEFFDNALGRPELLFSDSYDDIEQIRKVYFNRLEEKVNLTQFFKVFKWFDSSFTDIFEQLLPRKTKFLGVNFVIESHVLERHKYRYMFDDIYLSDSSRSVDRNAEDAVTIDGTVTKG